MTLGRWVRLARVASLAGLALYALVIFAAPAQGRLEGFFDVWVYNALLVAATVIVGARAYLEPRERAAWTAFTAALACWTFGEIYTAAVQPEAYPSPADLGFIAFYPLVYVGMVALLRAHARSIGNMLWLDGLTASLAAGALAAAILVELVLKTTEGSRSTVATNLAYPLGDVLLLSAVFGVFSLTRWRPGHRWLLLGLGVLSTSFADAVYLFQSSSGTYVGGTWVDIFWPAAMLLIALAAWAEDRSGEELSVEGRPLLVVPATCALVAIGVLVYDHFDQLNLLALGLATATLLAVVVRLVMTFRENRRLYELTKHEAATDALTGLANRRQLLADLSSRFDGPTTRPALLMVFDLDGFKRYNDTFGHPAGDALLTRLGAKLAAVPGPDGCAYRLGGDEFCLIVPVAEGEAEGLIDRACDALSEHGEGFEVGTSFGAVLLPDEAGDATRPCGSRTSASTRRSTPAGSTPTG